LLGETNGLAKTGQGKQPTIIQHQDIEEYLGRYCGLMLYLKEMDEAIYGRLCAVSVPVLPSHMSVSTSVILF
jgi:hypothetical protein